MDGSGGSSSARRVGGARSVVVLEREVAVVAGVRNAADARLVELVAEALAGGQWSGSRIYTPVQWVMVRAGVSRVAAQRIVALARRAGELPETMRRFSEGRISVDQAAVVARFVPAEFEASVAEMAESATVAQLVRSTKEYDFDTDAPERDDAPEPTPAEPVPEAPDRGVERSVAFGTDDGGQWWAQIKLPADEGMEVEAAWRAERDRLIEAGRKAARDKAAAAKAATAKAARADGTAPRDDADATEPGDRSSGAAPGDGAAEPTAAGWVGSGVVVAVVGRCADGGGALGDREQWCRGVGSGAGSGAGAPRTPLRRRAGLAGLDHHGHHVARQPAPADDL